MKLLPNKIKKVWDLVWASKITVVGLSILFFWIFVSIAAPLLTPYTPSYQDWKSPNQGPSFTHPLGTDEMGRDLWSRLIYGARVVLVILPLSEKYWLPGGTAIWGVLIALILGIALGLLSGYRGGWIDEIIMRILDGMLAMPVILLYLIIISSIGASALNIVLAMAIVSTPGIARLVRSLALDIRTKEYIQAARIRGENQWRIMFIEILPNAKGPIIVDAMLEVGYAVFAMGTLGFLGLGMPPPSPDWGSMIAKSQNQLMAGHPWGVIWPALALASLVVGLNLIADGLREESLRYQ
jgi:peptide/nickel transport system permease protein